MSKPFHILCVALALAAAGCGASANVDAVPLGANVQVTRQDGGLVQGRLSDRDRDRIRIADGSTNREVARRDIVDVRVVDDKTEVPLPAAAKYREVRVPDGTRLSVRLQSSVASNTSRVEDPVEASLVEPVRVNGIEVLPAGSVLQGHVAAAQPSGKVSGRASLAVRFSTVVVRGESYPIAAGVEAVARATKGDDAEKIGLPAAGGAILGALVGGKKGAAVGTAIGAGAGTAVVLTTSGDEVRWTRGETLTVPLDRGVDVRVPIRKS